MRLSGSESNIWLIGVLLLCGATGCVPMPKEPPVHVTTTLVPDALKGLPRPPPTLTSDEEHTAWGQEYSLGRKFAQQSDYYRAATCFHRARFLVNDSASTHQAQLLHALLLTYSLGGKYQEAIDAWETVQTAISIDDPDTARDCIGLLYEAYLHVNRPDEAASLLNNLPPNDPMQKKLQLFSRLTLNDETAFLNSPETAHGVGFQEEEEASSLALLYQHHRKDPNTARILNATLPGSGYLYVQQYQTAATAFVFNALFIVATWQLFAAHQPAAAIISGGFEGGWYLGGISGAGLAADTYNQRLRERLSKTYLEQYGLFPLKQMRYQW